MHLLSCFINPSLPRIYDHRLIRLAYLLIHLPLHFLVLESYILGKEGLIKQLSKCILERALEAMTVIKGMIQKMLVMAVLRRV
jgi:hypothetical protein